MNLRIQVIMNENKQLFGVNNTDVRKKGKKYNESIQRIHKA